MAIDRSLFTLDRLLDALLDDRHGNVDAWRRHAEIVPGYVAAEHPPRTMCIVRVGREFLRYGTGPIQGYFWDAYGDDFKRPEYALLALLQAPPPPSMVLRGLPRP